MKFKKKISELSTRSHWPYLFVITLLIGCTKSEQTPLASASQQQGVGQTQHAHEAEHAHGADKTQADPVNFSEALARVKSMKLTICKAFADGTPEEAHDALHEVGHLLEKLPELAAKDSQRSAEQMATINDSVTQLFDGFGKLDNTLHGGDEVDVTQLDAELTQAIASLTEVAQ